MFGRSFMFSICFLFDVELINADVSMKSHGRMGFWHQIFNFMKAL